MNKSVIGIIPAKKTSHRLPFKNRLLLGGKEMYQLSVDYAFGEGIKPIVSTDDEEIIKWCQNNNIDFICEMVDDSDMCNCVNQVLVKYPCDYFVLLMPTSPIREKNLVKRLLCEEDIKTSIYTAEKIKIIGHIGDTFMFAYRDQDKNTKFLYHFDGNIIIVNASWYGTSKKLFCDESKVVVQHLPYTLQVDDEYDFEIISKIKNEYNLEI